VEIKADEQKVDNGTPIDHREDNRKNNRTPDTRKAA
jgi:hypothetical protein